MYKCEGHSIATATWINRYESSIVSLSAIGTLLQRMRKLHRKSDILTGERDEEKFNLSVASRVAPLFAGLAK